MQNYNRINVCGFQEDSTADSQSHSQKVLTSDTAVSELTDCTYNDCNTATTATNTLTTCDEINLFESAELQSIFGLHINENFVAQVTATSEPKDQARIVTPETEYRSMPEFPDAKRSPVSSNRGHFFGRIRSLSLASSASDPFDGDKFQFNGNDRETYSYGEYKDKANQQFSSINSAGM